MNDQSQLLFDINQFPFDIEHSCLMVGGEAMIFHCHHYINYLQRSILDAEYIESHLFLIGSAADAVYHQLKSLCQGLDIESSKRLAEQMYKTFGYGLIDLSNMNENGIDLETDKSFFSKTWKMKFGSSQKPVDYYTTGYLAAAYAVIYNKPLNEIEAKQTECMTCGASTNRHVITSGTGNFTTYPPKESTIFSTAPKVKLGWEHEDTISNTFLGAHATFIGNDEGLLPAFGVYLIRNQSDYVNRLQFEFIKAMREIAGEYGEKLGSELLMEAGLACGFFTYGGMMTSQEWEGAVKPYLKTKEDWIRGLISVINTMGWGYNTLIELSPEKAVFRNYNDFEDLSFGRMYGKSDYPVQWAISGGFTGLMHLIYNTDLVTGAVLESEEGFRQMRRSHTPYTTAMPKSIACGDDYLEIEVYR